MTRTEFPLPQEILELVVSYISHDIDSLRRILQVCRAFAPVARKYLYREITLLDDKDDPERDRCNFVAKWQLQRPIFTEASFLALLKVLPFIGYFVKTVRLCGSTRCTKQKTYVTSKHLHLILPHLSSLESISFQRTRSGPWTPPGCVKRRYEPYILVTAQITKTIPPRVQSVWFSQVVFESEAAVDMFFSTCRHLTHLGLDKVSVLYQQHSLSGRITSAAKRVWSILFPSAPSIPPNVEPIELRSYAHGNLVCLPRLPFIDNEKAPYFKLSSVTNLKLYSLDRNDWDMLPSYWETLGRHTASSVQDLMIAVVLLGDNVYRPWSSVIWDLAGHKRLRSLFIVLWDLSALLENLLLPATLENLTILVCKRYLAWNELDAHLNGFPFISRVGIFLLASYPSLGGVGFLGFCSSTWDSGPGATDEWREEVIRGMPLLSDRGILHVK